MADIQQWRRKIQTSRVRTPAVQETNDDTDGIAIPMTPKRGLRPKISSYFTKDPGTAASVRVDAPTSLLDEKNSSCVLPTWPDDESFPSPDAEGLVDSIMCRLMAQPYACLEPRFNSAILRLLESHRCMNDERQKLQQQLDSEVKRGTLLYQRLQAAQKQWSDERQDFKAEIKRLELLLAKGKRGVAEVTLAREDSELRRKESVRRSRGIDDGLETIFEFLEKTRRWEDKAYGSQRAVLRPRQQSPSHEMRRLSKQLTTKKSLTNIHPGLPFGTPPDTAASTLAQAMRSPEDDARPMPMESVSDDTISTFSCAGDLFESENGNVNLMNAAGTDNDVVAVQRIAHVVARRRNIDTKDIMPKLLTLFDEAPPTSIDSEGFAGSPNNNDFNRPDSPIISDRLYAPICKEPSLMRKASGLLSKLRTEVGTDNSVPAKRSFSFEAGDDAVPVVPLWLTEASVRPCQYQIQSHAELLEFQLQSAAQAIRRIESDLESSAQVPPSIPDQCLDSPQSAQAGGSTSSGSSPAVFEGNEHVNQALAPRDNAFAAAPIKADDTGATPCLALTQPGSIRCYHQPPGNNVLKGSLYETGHPSDAVIAKENIRPTASLHSHED
ncbi:hypothetical protein D0867_09212 [Hortaea werneckii]|uniref:Uncharacterized protein n=1 Tax=Hortaea werneckii TaxID=91943 RepID=A0A3M6YXY4_HORWE|nr:hypothetical protein D0868_11645 [Hortaea werneckii]RMY07873.1 hypothetical protein D0867_09212 [Hortaea werneckii]